MPDREPPLPLSLWGVWWNAISLLRPAFSRLRTFMWFATVVAGLSVRVELLGVTSIVRALNLRPRLYTKLLDHFHSSGIKLDRLSASWTQAVLQLFPHPVRVNGRLVLVGDGIKAPKSGKKMPAVKLLHQQSESNTKPEYIMGHSMQAVGLLVHAAKSVFCVPLGQCASMKVWFGPTATSEPCSTRCSVCSISSLSKLPTTWLSTATTPPARWRKACSSKATIW